jgi:hypothetical protein
MRRENRRIKTYSGMEERKITGKLRDREERIGERVQKRRT